MRKRLYIKSVGFLLVTLFASTALGVSSTDQVAQEGEPVDERTAPTMGWPDGVMVMINDPARTNGWCPWFSEWPNDVNHYELHPAEPADIDRIIQALARIQSDTRHIVLSPDKEPRGLGFTTVLDEGNDTPCLFSIGSQKRLDQWFKQLPDGQFGVHHLTEAPTALPPTLTLYVANPMIDLAKLSIPTNIDVLAKPRPTCEEDISESPVELEINQFVADHKARQAAEAQTPETSEQDETPTPKNNAEDVQ